VSIRKYTTLIRKAKETEPLMSSKVKSDDVFYYFLLNILGTRRTSGLVYEPIARATMLKSW